MDYSEVEVSAESIYIVVYCQQCGEAIEHYSGTVSLDTITTDIEWNEHEC